MTGKIIRGVGGFYYVHPHQGTKVYECKARGVFRNRGMKPMVGDDCELTVLDDASSEGQIISILPRKNALKRPAVANCDQAVILFAQADPKPNLNLLDRFLVSMELISLPVAVVFSKADLKAGEVLFLPVEDYRNAGYDTYAVSAKFAGEHDPELSRLKERLAGKTTVLAGPSGVGKSTLINYLIPAANKETGELSEKIRRGKHTTRASELLFAGDDTYLMDTPGFSSLTLEELSEEQLKDYFPEISACAGKCRFLSCNHVGEPDCAVAESVSRGEIPQSRYESYCQLFREIHERRKW